jgi:hypothetical protein
VFGPVKTPDGRSIDYVYSCVVYPGADDGAGSGDSPSDILALTPRWAIMALTRDGRHVDYVASLVV